MHLHHKQRMMQKILLSLSVSQRVQYRKSSIALLGILHYLQPHIVYNQDEQAEQMCALEVLNVLHLGAFTLCY